MTDREHTLVTISALAAKSGRLEPLRIALHDAKTTELATRDELYECFLQLYLFGGFPAALEAMKALHRVWPIERENVEEIARKAAAESASFAEQGEELYRSIYRKNADVVRAEMLKLSPELAAWAVVEGYGKTLSRPALDVQTRELCIVGILTNLGWERQLFSHILGALNVGVPHADIAEAIAIGAMDNAALRDRGIELLDRARTA